MKRLNFFSCVAMAVLLLLSTLSLHVEAINEGDIIPDFTLTDMDGNTHHLYEYAGSIIFFNVFGVT
jgi:peroxiredoxin